MLIPGFLLRHTAAIEPYLGTGPSGPKYGPAATVRCFTDERTRVIRSPDGDEVTSSATVYARPDTVCPVKSRVTLASGRRTTVMAALNRNGGGLPTPDHLEIQLL